MTFVQKFAKFNTLDLNLGAVIIFALIVWEIWGATHGSCATITYFIRTTVYSWKYGRELMYAVWIVLGWHFCFYDSPWWLHFCSAIRRAL